MNWEYKGPDGKRGVVRVAGHYACDNWEVLREWAMAGLGVALKSTWDVRRQLEDGSLVPLLPDYDFGTDVAIYAVYPHRRYLPAKTRVFIDYLAESFGPEPYWDQPADSRRTRTETNQEPRHGLICYGLRPRRLPDERSGRSRHARQGLPRRQVHAREGPRVPHRHAGADPPAAAAARARPARGPQHRRLRLRLPRLAAGRPRPGAVARAEASRGAPREVPARGQRRPRGHRHLGHAAGRTCSRARSTTASTACGTARARAWTAAATSSSTRTPRARRRTAACWCSRATTMPPSPPRSRTRASTS